VESASGARSVLQEFTKLEEPPPIAEPMRTYPGWILVATFTVVLATVSPGVGMAAAELTHSADSAIVSPFATITNVTASNWAGYAGLGSSGSVTSVSGTWVEPTVNCTSGKTTDVATWVGIDGYSTTDLVQTGASGDCNGHTASYYAWWEVLPAPETTIPSITVHHGNTITASVTYSASTGKFSMKLTDGNHTFTRTEAVKSTPRNSAECIVERDEVGGALNDLSKFKTDTFSTCSATISGSTGGIGTFATVSRISMYNGSTLLEKTGSLSSGKKFTVTWKAYG
jgi:Peptidase A4 family